MEIAPRPKPVHVMHTMGGRPVLRLFALPCVITEPALPPTSAPVPSDGPVRCVMSVFLPWDVSTGRVLPPESARVRPGGLVGCVTCPSVTPFVQQRQIVRPRTCVLARWGTLAKSALTRIFLARIVHLCVPRKKCAWTWGRDPPATRKGSRVSVSRLQQRRLVDPTEIAWPPTFANVPVATPL